jgi:hypothetical protein
MPLPAQVPTGTLGSVGQVATNVYVDAFNLCYRFPEGQALRTLCRRLLLTYEITTVPVLPQIKTVPGLHQVECRTTRHAMIRPWGT